MVRFSARTSAVKYSIPSSRARSLRRVSSDTVAIVVGSSSHAMHRVVGSVAVSLARHSPVPIVVVP